MKVTEENAASYAKLICPDHTFNRVEFAELNTCAADGGGDVRYLIFSDSKVRAGLIVGRRGNELRSPFSAPFGGLSAARGALSMESVDDIAIALTDYCHSCGMTLKITIPPLWLHPDLSSKTAVALLSQGFKTTADINYHIDLTKQPELCKSARKKLRQAVDYGLRLEHLEPSPDNIKRVYNVIRNNHESHGYEMRRSLENYLATDAIMDADYFMVSLNGNDIAAAANYTVAPGATIGAGWGDVPGFSELRPMNMLGCGMADFYRNKGFRILDLGPAAENGAIFRGLCTFKESLGATASLKFSFIMT